MEAGLKGKKALITGGGTGIGKGIALSLAREGVHIAFATRNAYPETIKEIEELGVKAFWIKTDVGKEEEVVKMVDSAINILSGLDFYINNAASHWDEPVTKITTEGWLNTINTNLSACIWACREVSKYFISQKKGSILIIGSTVMYGVLQKETSYRISKFGLKSYMESLGVELAPFDIRVNMIIPGFFVTRMTENLGMAQIKESIAKSIPLRKPGDPYKDIGPTAVILLSDKLSPYTTCSEIVIDGGARVNHGSIYSEDEIINMNLG